MKNKWKNLNKETKIDIICLTQGYLGIILLIGFYYFGIYKGWWAF